MAVQTRTRSSLLNPDCEARLLDFERQCRRERTTEVVSESDLITIRRFLYFHINTPAQGFRQRILTSVKYLLLQLKGSGYQLYREIWYGDNADERKHQEHILTRYQDFVRWLVEFCFYCLRIRGNYARRAAVLHILNCIYGSTLLEDKIRHDYIKTWNLDRCLTTENVDALVDVLTDSYESNQILALQILKLLECPRVVSLDWPALLETAIRWCSTCKTQYPETAVHYFLLLVNKVDLASHLPEKKDTDSPETNSAVVPRASLSLKDRNCFLLLRHLLALLRKTMIAMENNLIQAAVGGPPWGLLRSSLYILKEINWSSVLGCDETCSSWRAVIEDLLILCHRFIAIVSPVVNSESPEGYLPTDIDILSERLHHATCQAVLVCCWRTHKEISSIFGFLAGLQHPPQRSILTFAEFLSIGNYFMIQLTECKHRGAFECAYAEFVGMCRSAWTSPIAEVRDSPSRWLRTIIDGLVSLSDGRGICNGFKYCVTRRSAGVPFLTQAILATEPVVRKGPGSCLLYETLHKLLRILFDDEGGDDKDVAKVHSLNILRALVRESRLGVMRLTPPWLSLIVQGNLLLFTHRSWAVRNSASLLFSSLMMRVFGVPRQRDQISSKNRLSSTEFNSLCPGLLDFLLDQLRVYSSEHGTSAATTGPFRSMILFPILSILSRLYPSSLTNILREFVPYVLDILFNCSVIHVRRSAVTALSSIAERTTIEELVGKFARVVVADGHRLPQNAINGMLLLIAQQLQTSGFSSFGDVIVPAGLSKNELSPVNAAKLYQIAATQERSDEASSTSMACISEIGTDSPVCLDMVYGPFVSCLLTSTLKKKAITDYDAMRTQFRSSRRFRLAFYKQWRSLYKRYERHRRELVSVSNEVSDRELVWRDITRSGDDLSLCVQACKFYLSVHQPNESQDKSQERARHMFHLYRTFAQGVLRRRFFQLACHFFNANEVDDDQLGGELLRELDVASKPSQLVDERWMVLDCIARLEPHFLERKTVDVSIILIRLLTDVEDVVREEAAKQFSIKFVKLDEAVQPFLALFICVVRLVTMVPNNGGKRALCRFLLEIADDLARTDNENSNEERIFDKNEPNYNLEPLLLADWLRLLSKKLANGAVQSECDVLPFVDACLEVDGLKCDQFSRTLRNQSKELISCQLLRHLLEEMIEEDRGRKERSGIL